MCVFSMGMCVSGMGMVGICMCLVWVCVSGMGMVWVCVCVWYGYGRNVCVSGMGMVWGMCVFGYTHLIIYDF